MIALVVVKAGQALEDELVPGWWTGRQLERRGERKESAQHQIRVEFRLEADLIVRAEFVVSFSLHWQPQYVTGRSTISIS